MAINLFDMDCASEIDKTAIKSALLDKGAVHDLESGTAQWREVSARRARKLRRRGVLCLSASDSACNKLQIAVFNEL